MRALVAPVINCHPELDDPSRGRRLRNVAHFLASRESSKSKWLAIVCYFPCVRTLFAS